MTKTKSNDWRNRPISEWNVATFTAYLTDRHREVYGTEYLPPGRNWRMEQGLIGSLIGTKGRNPKPRKHEPELIKRFIDECFRIHRCTPEYPNVSFTWLWKWKTAVLVRVVAEAEAEKAKARRSDAVEEVGVSAEELDGWL